LQALSHSLVLQRRGSAGQRLEPQQHPGVAQRVRLDRVQVEELGDPLVVGPKQLRVYLGGDGSSPDLVEPLPGEEVHFEGEHEDASHAQFAGRGDQRVHEPAADALPLQSRVDDERVQFERVRIAAHAADPAQQSFAVQRGEGEALGIIQRQIWTTGLSGVSLDGIARSAGLNRPSLAASFGGKDEIYAKAARHFVGMMDARMNQALSLGDLETALRTAFDAAIDIYTANGPDGCFVICTAPAEAQTSPVCRAVLDPGHSCGIRTDILFG